MRPGAVVANRFRIEEIAGTGGMGTVYRATDLVAGGNVALKTLAGIGERDAARFAREAAVLAQLVHPGIVRYVAHGLTADHEHYIAMEWLQGITLHERLQRGRMGLGEAIAFVRAVAEALAVAHARGVVHRDVKPMNLFLPDGDLARVKVLDFGIARHIHQAGLITHTGAVIGTPGYMAPEQVRGETNVDARTDVFSLGCVLYRCLTGISAFGGDQSLAVLAKILVEDVIPPSTIAPAVPPVVDELVLAMLHKDPAARPANARVVADELARLVDVTVRDRSGERDTAAAPSTANDPFAATVSTERLSRGAITAAEKRLVSIVLMVPNTDVTADEPARVGTIATAYGGRLERIGDGSNLVLFAHAEVASDHAARAARCALALRDGIGTATYVVASGRVAVDKQLVGDVIDRAAAEVQDPTSGQIVIDDATAHLLDERFVITERGKRRYLRGIRDSAEPVRTLLGRTSPIVGRDRELSSLESLWIETADDGIAHAVLVTAPPGAGKSRLRQELVRRILQRDEHAELLIGRGDSLRAGSPFSMIADAMRRAAGLREGDSLDVQRDALRARIARHVAPDGIDRITHMLGEISGVPFPTDASESLRVARADPQAMGDLIKGAWVDWLEAEAHHHPVLLVLEDLHWGDRPTIDLVDAALRELATKSFMVVALARPEIHDTFPKLWANRDLQEVRLPQLARKAAERLVRDVLGAAVDASTIGRVVDRAAGNAFFLEELIRAVAEGRDESLPDSVLSMLQLRLDALGGEVKRVLRAASVFGEVFWRGGVAVLLGSDPNAELTSLVERELVTQASQSRMPGEVEYAFRHDLVREAAYETMSNDDRAGAHRLAGEWLVSHGYGDAIALAGHFFLGNELERAAELFARAAEQAIAGNDADAVFVHARRGLACKPSGEVAARLQCAVAEAHNWRGEHATAIEVALAARAEIKRGSRLFFVATDEAFYGSGRGGDIPRAIGFVHDLTATVAEPGAELAQLRSVARAAIVMLRFGPPGVGAALTDRAEDLATRVTVDVATEQRLHTIRALRARSVGDAVRAISEHEAGERACAASHNLRELAFNHLSLGGIYGDLGAPELALPILEKGLQLAERIGASTVTPLLTFAAGLANLEMGNLAAAREWGERAVRLASERDRAAEGIARWVIARAALASKDYETAERELAWCIDNLTAYGQFRAFALATQVRLDLVRGDVANAREHAAQAMALLRNDTGFEDGEATVRLAQIEALEAAGDHAAAKAATKIALERLESRASMIQEPWRSRFLAKPDNRATLARR